MGSTVVISEGPSFMATAESSNPSTLLLVFLIASSLLTLRALRPKLGRVSCTVQLPLVLLIVVQLSFLRNISTYLSFIARRLTVSIRTGACIVSKLFLDGLKTGDRRRLLGTSRVSRRCLDERGTRRAGRISDNSTDVGRRIRVNSIKGHCGSMEDLFEGC